VESEALKTSVMSDGYIHKTNLGDLSRDGLTRALRILGAKPAAAASIFLKYYKGREGELDCLSPKLWDRIIAKYPPAPGFSVEKKVSSRDGTVKFLLRFEDGSPAECVLLNGKDGRITACLSSQSGCPCGCKFCATGKLGFRRNLYPSEIISQFKTVLAEAGHIDNIVFMGMGEPFLNWDNVRNAILILSDPKAFAFSQGKITVSTVGIMPIIEELVESDLKIKLAISVITSSDEKRRKIAPMQEKYPISRVLELAGRYATAKKTQILAEYILFEGENDSLEDADSLIGLLKGVECRVNLIPVNRGMPQEGVDRVAAAKEFQHRLMDAGFRTYLRMEKGADISAACGQLAAE